MDRPEPVSPDPAGRRAGRPGSTNSVWKYLDDGSNQGTAWVSPDFIDSSWPSGRAKLGYGDGMRARWSATGPTPRPNTPPPISATPSTWPIPASFSPPGSASCATTAALSTSMARRSSRPHAEGDVTYLTYASGSAVGGAEETTFFTALVNPNLLVAGPNVLAVEIHQINATSSDLAFNLEFVAAATRSSTIRRWPTSSARSTTQPTAPRPRS